MANRKSLIGVMVALVLVFGILTVISAVYLFNTDGENKTVVPVQKEELVQDKYSFEEDMKFHSSEGGFSLIMFGTPKRSIQVLETEFGNIPIMIFQVEKENITYTATYTEIGKYFDEELLQKDFYDGANKGMIDALGGRLVYETPVFTDGNAGREIKVEVGDEVVIIQRNFLIDGKNHDKRP